MQLGIGMTIGAVLMIQPAFCLLVLGAVHLRINHVLLSGLGSAALSIASASFAEELLFRGFIFQRLNSAFGRWPAQLVTGTLFLLTHLNNPGMTDITKVIASINIVVASLLFGIVYLRTRKLAMTFGIHFMANCTQGIIRGFGVSGETKAGFFEACIQ